MELFARVAAEAVQVYNINTRYARPGQQQLCCPGRVGSRPGGT